MMQRVFSKDFALRAARMVLVFALVFWSSFRVECLAFAQIINDDGNHEGQVLSNLTVWQVTDPENVDDSVLKQKMRSASDTAQGIEQSDPPRVSVNGGQLRFVALPDWNVAQVATYTVTYTDGSGGQYYSTEVREGDPTPTIEDPTLEGYTFAGWSPEVAETVTGNVEYVAQWTEVQQPEPTEPTEPTDPTEPTEPGEGDDFTDIEPQSTEAVASASQTPAYAPLAFPVVKPAALDLEPQADDVTIANFVKWTLDEGSESFAEIHQEGGVATLVGKAPGLATVRCTLAEGFDTSKIDPAFEGDFSVAFTVRVMGISAIEIYRADTEAETRVDGETLDLTDEQREGFRLWAYAYAAFDESGSEKYQSTAGSSLSKSSDGLFKNLSWSVVDDKDDPVEDSVASITDEGVLTVADNTSVKVRCTSEQGFGGTATAELTVRTGDAQKDKADQGDHFPQDPLTIIIKTPKAAGQDGEGEDEGGQESGDGDNQDSGIGEQAEGDDEQGGDAEGEGEGGQDAVDVKTFEIKAEDFFSASIGPATEETYPMLVDGQLQTVTGRGHLLQTVLNAAGLDLDDQDGTIDTIEFQDGYDNEPLSFSWDELFNISKASPILVASESYVHEPDEDAGQDGGQNGDQAASGDEGDKSQGGESRFLPNTRFRVMFDQSKVAQDVNGGNLRWIKAITVNMKGAEPPEEEEPQGDPKLGVSIDYIPAPKGADAFLSAVPNQSIGGANFGFTWERSTDNGKTWEELDSDAVQTLRVRTDDAHIGNLYRVTLNTNLTDDDGETRWARSSEVKIVIGDGISLALYYVPPLAGDWANFTSQLRVIDPSHPEGYREVTAEKYIWQISTDGGVSWSSQDLENETGPALKIKTNPVEPSEDAKEGEDGEKDPITLTYVRVRALYEGEMYTSNMQLLTVRVDNGEGGSEPTNDDKSKQIEDAWGDVKKPENQDPADPSKPSTPSSGGSAPKITPIDSVTYENAETPTQTEPSDAFSDEPSNLIVNDQFSEMIKQQEQQQQQEDATTPGARWRELSPANPDDVRRALEGNPFAPLAAPFALGMTAAGAVEKLAAFRRQIK